MPQENEFLRYASPNERRTISREDLGYYNAVIISGFYELESDDVDITLARSFIPPLKHCVQEHPFLSVVVKDKDTENPYFERVPSIDLINHIYIIHDTELAASIKNNGEIATVEKLLPGLLDRPWPDYRIPPWRIVVLPLVSQGENTGTRCFIAFTFSHTLGDGMAGPAFHRTFLNAWRTSTTTTNDAEGSSLVTPPDTPLPEPFDTAERLTISWGFLLQPLVAELLPKFIGKMLGLRVGPSTVDAGTWIGSRMFFDPEEANRSRIKVLEIEAPLVQKALQISRRHDAKLTAMVHQMIVRALSKSIPNRDVTNFVSGTAVDMRGSIGMPQYTWGLYVSGHYDVHPRPSESDTESPTLSDEMWSAASTMTKKLAQCGKRLHDQSVGLLRYAPSIRNWTQGKLGQPRDCSYEVSNLLAFDGAGVMENGAEHKCRVKVNKMVFTQPGYPLSSALAFNIISVKGGSLVCTVSWQKGALGVVPVDEEKALVDGICSSIRADFEALNG